MWWSRGLWSPAPCHHLARGDDVLDVRPLPHGTLTGYIHYGCRCEDCGEANRAQARAYRLRQPERVAEIARRSRERNIAKERARRKAYYAANRVKAVTAAVAWAKANPDKARANKARYKKLNPEKNLAHVELRRARKQAADTRVITDRDWGRLVARHNHRCAYCGERRKLTQDHVIPLVRGGRHAIGNLLPACGPCNSSKGTKLLVEWRSMTSRQLPVGFWSAGSRQGSSLRPA